MRASLRSVSFALSFCFSACGGDNHPGMDTAAGASSLGGSAGQNSARGGSAGSVSIETGGSSGATSGGAGGSAQGTAASAFRYGFNAGYPNPKFNDQDLAALGVRAGATSERVSLPEQHLERWGYDIEVADVKAYRTLGMGSLVGFLTSPTRAHSTAPADASDDQVGQYIPKNLYEPITTANGEVNPNNYWASYVYRTVSTYGSWIDTWEIWNEPDWVSDWKVTEAWATRAPSAADLPRFHGSIFDYVRMLRVSSVAAKLANPNAKIATGGIGYPNFLDAIVRYSDEPKAGAIDADHPATGKAYFDVVSFHHYPIYTPGNSEAGVDGFMKQRQALGALVDPSRVLGWECTETGAPHLPLDGIPSGSAYAKNYLLKVMALAPSADLGGVHWFVLSDAKAAGQSTDPYAFMGLYAPVASLSTPSEAELSESGVAYATLSQLLRGAHYDGIATSALGLPGTARGIAYRSADDARILVLWAIAPADSETASTSVELASPRTLRQHAWDFSKTGQSQLLTPVNGVVTLALEATPRIFVEQ
ncbi:MAG TPA: hypothetical protein VFQ35_16360 [Polyangiaceae bacterium]|nr:hypothetical protein [Polyangiaceae bacterium]